MLDEGTFGCAVKQIGLRKLTFRLRRREQNLAEFPEFRDPPRHHECN
ncbi:hypothetical protein SAMN05192568_105315 [Methylobacterium pseudosasicola]|uniref:Uncharacterized protein n=1 Tax=Methylobacterium pseudosasicola TaxID=582667 RepID=A0A1I4TFL6_9HYPH|nr:hypothetical protein SAMN05192568_105315 [Methylobacterium pseudosasicola]